MKKWFNVAFTILMLGWLPFIFLAGWGMYQSPGIRITVAIIGFFLCLIGMMGLLNFTNDKNWWLNKAQLDTKEKAYDALIQEAIDVRNTLTKKIVREDRNNDFVVAALNAYWHDANVQLQRKDLGDIERKNYEYQLSESKRLMDERG